jgi:hypothetical protein
VIILKKKSVSHRMIKRKFGIDPKEIIQWTEIIDGHVFRNESISTNKQFTLKQKLKDCLIELKQELSEEEPKINIKTKAHS